MKPLVAVPFVIAFMVCTLSCGSDGGRADESNCTVQAETKAGDPVEGVGLVECASPRSLEVVTCLQAQAGDGSWSDVSCVTEGTEAARSLRATASVRPTSEDASTFRTRVTGVVEGVALPERVSEPLTLSVDRSTCTSLEISSAKVETSVNAGSEVPAPLGGALVPGTYELTDRELFGSGGAIPTDSPRQSLRFEGDDYEYAGGRYSFEAGRVTASGTTLEFTPRCRCELAGCSEPSSSWRMDYSAESSKLVLQYSSSSGWTERRTFTLR
jgi:hypothetical protein